MARIAVLQISSAEAGPEARARCLSLVDEAVHTHRADVVVCPELDDERPTEDEASDLALALVTRARTHRVWIVSALTCEGATRYTITTPDGEQVACGDRREQPVVVSTPHGKLGLCAGAGVLDAHGPRALARQGADLVCASLGVCSPMAASLRLPARAVENRVVVAIASRGAHPEPYPHWKDTLPPELAPSDDAVQAGVSQIVGVEGRVLSVASQDSAIACVELTLTQVRAEGGDDEAARPALPRGVSTRPRPREVASSYDRITAAIVSLPVEAGGTLEDTLERVAGHLADLAADQVELVVLPELFCFADDLTEHAEAAAHDFITIVRRLADACQGTRMHVVTSLVEAASGALQHMGVVIGQRGVVMRQPQLYVSGRHPWATPGDRVETARLPWGRLALTVGDDALAPELFHLYGLQEVEVVAAPLSRVVSERAALSLPALADEERLAVVAAVRTDAQEAPASACSFIVDPGRWPAVSALPGQAVLSRELRLDALREERAARGQDVSGWRLKARMQLPAPAPN